jgi:hemerythrin
MERYVEWKPFYTVGDATLDDEHKRLLGMIDELHQVVRGTDDQLRFNGVLEELADYTVVHFEHEELAMRQCGYPNFDAHKTMHDEMRRRAQEFRANVNSVDAEELLRFLKDWWVRHIQNQDKGYAPYLDAVIGHAMGAK